MRTRAAPCPGNERTALVECVGVTRRYRGGVVAVREVSCVVSAGMRVALTGPSGSGKSTLLHLMAGLEKPSAGEMRWPGLGGPPGGRPCVVSVVFQGPSLLPALDVTENVALPLLLAGRPNAPAVDHALRALSRLGIAELAGRLPDELSGGQSQRVAVARVLASRPALILADEPTGQLDHDAGSHVVSVLLEAADELGAALVVATHDSAVSSRLAQQWNLRDGQLTGASLTSQQ